MDGNVKGNNDSLELQDDSIVGGNGYLLPKIGRPIKPVYSIISRPITDKQNERQVSISSVFSLGVHHNSPS
jgi:hypothetical protein